MNIFPYIRLFRPVQWLKNLMILFPPFLGGVIFQDRILSNAILPLVAFCLASSASYIVNDLIDIKADRGHPSKKYRPLPSGEIPVGNALVIAVIFLVLSLLAAKSVSLRFLFLLLAYLSVSTLYSLQLKNYPLLDIFSIASGFILRLLAGGEAFDISISEWLFLTVFLLALFLSTGKRYGEKRTLGEQAVNHRRALAAYPDGFLDGLLFMSGSAVLVTYTMYVIARHSNLLLYSVPLCCFGLLRYIMRVQSGRGGDPTESLTRDLSLLVVGVTWAVLMGFGIYG